MGRNNVFQKEHYIQEWRTGKLIGMTKQFHRDLKFSCQRITRGFSDADTWNIDMWFLRTMQEMLAFYKEHRHGSPGELGENVVDERGILINDTCHKEWDVILDRMIHLLREADEETTSAVNACQEEYDRASERFLAEYGLFGEKIDRDYQPQTDSDNYQATKRKPRLRRGKKSKKDNGYNNTSVRRLHTMTEIPEFKEIWERYRAEEDRISSYREKCKNEFMDLFKKWFWALWD